jgi:hypothetical protein
MAPDHHYIPLRLVLGEPDFLLVRRVCSVAFWPPDCPSLSPNETHNVKMNGLCFTCCV